jgi:hypothetical protein
MTTNEASPASGTYQSSPETDIFPPFAGSLAKEPQTSVHLHDRALTPPEVRHNVRSRTGTCAAGSSSTSSFDEYNTLFSRPESHREEGLTPSSSWTERQELCYLQKAQGQMR